MSVLQVSAVLAVVNFINPPPRISQDFPVFAMLTSSSKGRLLTFAQNMWNVARQLHSEEAIHSEVRLVRFPSPVVPERAS